MSNSPFSNPTGDFIKTFPIVQGINLDVTKFLSPSWVEGQHTRFDNGQPRKMGGFELISTGKNDIIRATHTVAIENKKRIFIFRNTGIWQIDVDENGIVSGEVNRTPIGWNTPGENDPDLYFSITEFTTPSRTGNVINRRTDLYVVGLPMTENIFNTAEAPIFFGDISGTDNFLPYEAAFEGESLYHVHTSGGIIELDNSLLIFGNNGIVMFTQNEPNIAPSILEGFSGRGSQKFVAARLWNDGVLLWSPSKLYYATFQTVGELTTLVFSIRSPAISIISPASIVDGFNNTYFWCGKKQFFSFTGVLNPFKNDFNRNFIFKNITPRYQGKVWGMFVEDFTEIWWFFPLDGETECSTLIKMNMEEQSWSKSTMYRASGTQASIFNYPILSSTIKHEYDQSLNTYPLWYHEKGLNMKVGVIEYPIVAWIQTNMMCLYREEQSLNFALRLRRFEKNIDQQGNMELQVLKYEYPDSTPVVSNPIAFTPNTTNIPLNEEASIISLRLTSNTLDGFYQFGKLYLDFEYGNPRPISESA